MIQERTAQKTLNGIVNLGELKLMWRLSAGNVTDHVSAARAELWEGETMVTCVWHLDILTD